MKTKSLLFSAAAAIVFFAVSSCSKMEQPSSQSVLAGDSPEGNFVVNIECGSPSGDGSRTAFTDDGKIQWAKGDVIYFMQRVIVDGAWKTPATSTTLTKEYSSVSLTISNFSKPDDDTDSWYCSTSPKPASSVVRDNEYLLSDIVTPDIQKPTTTGYDSSADLLISQYVKNLSPTSDGKYKLQFSYVRMISIAKMKVIKLPSSSKISSVTFSAIKEGNKVVLAGKGRYNYKTGEREKVEESKTSLTLDYSEQNITANEGMTAYFTCYPFELGAGDSFTVKVTTKAGEVFEKVVTLTDAMIAKLGGKFQLAQSCATQFTVDMSNAARSYTWLTISNENPSEFTEGSHKILAIGIGCTTGTVTSLSYKRVLASDYQTAVKEGKVDELYAEGMTQMKESTINNTVNAEKIACYTFLADGKIAPDTDYCILVKLTDSSKGEVKAAGNVHSEPFAFLTSATSASYTSGQFGHKFYGANIESIQYLAVESSAIGGTLNNTNCKNYFENHKTEATSVTASTINKINDNGAAGYGYFKISKTFAAGAECVDLVLATMTDGSTKFCWKTQKAKE